MMPVTLTRRAAISAVAALAISERVTIRARAADTTSDILTMQAAYINDAEFLGYFIGMETGAYRAANLDLRYLQGGPDVIPESALLSEKADLALTTVDTTANAIIRQNAPFKIIGTQFQKNPMGIISLEGNPIRSPAELAGKTISVSAVSLGMMHAYLKLCNLPRGAVRVVPDSQSDPTALLTGVVDAALGFVTDFPYVVAARGKRPVVFLLADHGLPLYNDTVVVTDAVLKSKRSALVRWLKASRVGWEENFRDPSIYPKRFHDTWLKPAGRSVDYDTFSNQAYGPLMRGPGGIFSMSEESIAQNIETLNRLGIKATRPMFDRSLLAELS